MMMKKNLAKIYAYTVSTKIMGWEKKGRNSDGSGLRRLCSVIQKPFQTKSAIDIPMMSLTTVAPPNFSLAKSPKVSKTSSRSYLS